MAIKRIAVEFGMGTDLRGKDYTKAACRALRDALWHNSLTIYRALGYSPDEMLVEITIGVAEPDKVDHEQLKKILPYGTASITVNSGGLNIPHQDGPDVTTIANAAVIVSLDIDEADKENSHAS